MIILSGSVRETISSKSSLMNTPSLSSYPKTMLLGFPTDEDGVVKRVLRSIEYFGVAALLNLPERMAYFLLSNVNTACD